MALRILEVRVPAGSVDAGEVAREMTEEYAALDVWEETSGSTPDSGPLSRFRVLVDAADTEPILDELERRFGDEDEFRVLILPVEAALPRRQEKEEEEAEATGDEEAGRSGLRRVSREELYADLTDATELGPTYLVMIGLSAVVCAFGLITDETAVVIGAMVIAPLLGPLTALSLATTLADGELGRRSLRAGGSGLTVAFGLSVLIGLLVPAEPSLPQIVTRTSAGLEDVGLALAAGSAGTLAFTAGTAEAIVGVMVAVALVPPLAAAGLLLGSGYPAAAGGAALLTVVNVICVNLAGVVTFLLQGVQPNSWWEAKRARRATRWALVLWGALLAILVGTILYLQAP